MKKRVMTLVLVVVLVCTLMPVAAFAEGGSGTVSIGSEVTAPKYTLAVPKSAAVVLNPYLVGGSDAVGVESPILSFVNSSDLPVVVNVSLIPKVAAATELVSVTTAIQNIRTNTAKQMFLYAQFPSDNKVPDAGATFTPVIEAEDASDLSYSWEASKKAPNKGTEADGSDEIQNYSLFAAGTGTIASTDFTVVLNQPTFTNGAITQIPKTAYTGFKLKGDISAYGGWVAADFGINLVYDAELIMPDEYTAIVTGYPTAQPAVAATGAKVGHTIPAGGTEDNPVSAVAPTSVQTYTAASAGSPGFATRQVNLPASTSTVTKEITVAWRGVSSVDTIFASTVAAGTTEAKPSSVGVTLTKTDSGVKIASSTSFAKTITIYVKALSATGATIGIYPITINFVK